MTLGDRCRQLEKAGVLPRYGHGEGAYDYAVPQPWADDVRDKTGIYPPGHVVWLYNKDTGIGGRPFPVTLLGWMALKRYEHVHVRESIFAQKKTTVYFH